MKNIIQVENAHAPIGPYSHALKVDKFLFVSDQVGIDPEEGKIIAIGITEQTARGMENIRRY